MTPFLREIWLRFQTIGKPTDGTRRAIEQVENSLAFEVTDILPLVGETIHTLEGSTLVGSDGKPVVGHGGLLVMPHDYVWLEWRQEHDAAELDRYAKAGLDKNLISRARKFYRVGAMLYYNETMQTISVEITSQLELEALHDHCVLHSHIHLLPDETCRVVCYSSDHRNKDPIVTECAGKMGVYVLGMLLILNAPYGIKKDIQQLHKAHAKEAKQKGFQLKPHRVVYIDKTKAPPVEPGKHEPAFHKAFHFVRSHLRHFKDGTHTLVKAHWRGDPRLGICPMADYKVRP